jgi:DNA ligase-1
MNNFKPHLCDTLERDKLQFPLIAMRKYDGCRLLNVDGAAVGRSLKQYKNRKLTEHFSQQGLYGIDCEIVATYENDPDLCRHTTSLVNTIEGGLPNAVVIFDLLDLCTIGKGYKERMDAVKAYRSCFEDTLHPVKVIIPDLYEINSVAELDALYEKFLEEGYEGIIVRKPDGKHKNGRCTVKEGNYLRDKPTLDAEGVCIRLEEAYENQNEAKINELGHTERSTHQENMVPKGMVGALWLLTPEGKEIKVGAGKLKHEERKFYWENPDKIIGQIVKYAFLGVGELNAPRHPRFISFRAEEDMSN